MTETQQVPAGWHTHPHTGKKTWWDGTQWGEPKKTATVPVWLSLTFAALGLILGLIIGAGSSSGLRTELSEANGEIVSLQSRVEFLAGREEQMDDLEAELQAREEAVTQTEQAVEANTIPGDGVYLVGSQIAPGTYQSVDNERCYWERLQGTSGEFDDIITNENVEGQGLVTIEGSDVAFSTSGCTDWVKVG